MRQIFDRPPALLPTHSCDSSSGCFVAARRVATLGLLLLGLLIVCSVAASCTISEITLYKTVNYPAPKPTPLVKIGPS